VQQQQQLRQQLRKEQQQEQKQQGEKYVDDDDEEEERRRRRAMTGTAKTWVSHQKVSHHNLRSNNNQPERWRLHNHQAAATMTQQSTGWGQWRRNSDQPADD
jgi:hypothetical protein